MALQKNLTLDNGINLPNGYIKVTLVNMATNQYVDISVEIFKDRAASDDKRPSVVKFEHKCSSNVYHTYFSIDVMNQEGVNVIGQCYNYLKTLPFYSNATDVMDVKE